jgi:hypothetical protein
VWPTEAQYLEDQNVEARKKPERRQALQEAKQAVRTYAREPSRANADAVEMAWRKVRQLDSVARWREGRSAQGVPDRGAEARMPEDRRKISERAL